MAERLREGVGHLSGGERGEETVGAYGCCCTVAQMSQAQTGTGCLAAAASLVLSAGLPALSPPLPFRAGG